MARTKCSSDYFKSQEVYFVAQGVICLGKLFGDAEKSMQPAVAADTSKAQYFLNFGVSLNCR